MSSPAIVLMGQATAGDFVQAEVLSNVAHSVARHAQNPVRQKRVRENHLARYFLDRIALVSACCDLIKQAQIGCKDLLAPLNFGKPTEQA